MYRVAFFLDKAQINEVSLKELIVENSDVTLHDVAYTVSHVESWTDLDGPGLHVAHAHVYPKLVKPAIFSLHRCSAPSLHLPQALRLWARRCTRSLSWKWASLLQFRWRALKSSRCVR